MKTFQALHHLCGSWEAYIWINTHNISAREKQAHSTRDKECCSSSSIWGLCSAVCMWLSQDVSEIHTAGAEFGSFLAAWYIFLGMSGISHCLLNWYRGLHEVLTFKACCALALTGMGGSCSTGALGRFLSRVQPAHLEAKPLLTAQVKKLVVCIWSGFAFSEVHVRLVGSRKNEI